MSKKVILNKCYGGFDVSEEGYRLYCQKKGLPCRFYRGSCYTDGLKDGVRPKSDRDCLLLYEEYREDPTLIEVVEELGEKANTNFSELEVVEIPGGMDYYVDDYDGIETLRPANTPCW